LSSEERDEVARSGNKSLLELNNFTAALRTGIAFQKLTIQQDEAWAPLEYGKEALRFISMSSNA
jgi:hypothetical protein